MDYEKEYAILVGQVDRVISLLEEYGGESLVVRKAVELLTAALLGAGSARGRPCPRVVRRVFLTWLLTFPCCGAIAFLLARLVLSPALCAAA